MLTLKVYWGGRPTYNEAGENMPLYSVYTAEKYLVDPLSAETTRLLLDDGKHDIALGKGSRTFVMNGTGATVDTIIVN